MKCLLLLCLLCGSLVACTDIAGFDLQCRNPAHLLVQRPVCAPENNHSIFSTQDPKKADSHPPLCFGSYCTHTAHYYRDIHSLSIISTSQAFRNVVKARKHAVQTPQVARQNRYDIRAIPSKGKGVLATQRIAKGDVIMLDSPAIIASAQVPAHVTPSEGFQLFQTAVQRLDPATQAGVLALDGHGSTGVDGIMETNAFSCRFDDGGTGDDYLCLYPDVSRINHACRPNAHAKFSPRTLLMEIRALRDILPGEEISISYGKVDMKYAERQDLYRKNWGFGCTCELCAAGEKAVAESDQRKQRFAELHERLTSLTAETFDAQRVIGWENEVFAISDREGLEALVAEDLERMAYVYAALGDRAEAVMWAQKARDNMVRWKVATGVDSDDVKRIEEVLLELDAA